MNKKTSTLLMRCGVPPHIHGFEYLGEAIEMISADPKMLHAMISKVYPSIAEKVESTPSKVCRAMRIAIDIAFDTLTPESIEEIFGNSIRYDRDKPTNKHFIAALIEMMKE